MSSVPTFPTHHGAPRVVIGLLLGAFDACSCGGDVEPDRARDEAFQREFVTPGAGVRPKADWFLPEDIAALSADELERQIADIATAGLGGVALFNVDLSLSADQNDRLKRTLEAARNHGLIIDLTLGAAFPPVGVPTITPDSPVAQHELVYGTVSVVGGMSFSGTVPAPAIDPAKPRTLVAVVAARCSTACTGPLPVLLEQDSLVDLTGSAKAGEIVWTAPEGGDWLLFGLWGRATETPYADYFSGRATEAVIAYWDEHVFTPEIEALLEGVGGEIFEDSLHLEGTLLWTPELLSEFERRRGYSLRPYLPLIFIPYLNDWYTQTFVVGQSLSPDSAADFDLSGDVGRRIRNDYYQTLSELYAEHHLTPLNRWARSRGLPYRAKASYGQSFDISAAILVDVPNSESFQQGNRMEGIRAMAGAVHLGHQGLFAVECCPTVTRVGQDFYSTTWQQMLTVLQATYAAGANQVMLHGITYGGAPDAPWPGAYWPFFGLFGPGLAEAFGPWMPYWEHMPVVTTFLAREQHVLRQGEPKVDVAIYRHSYWSHGFPFLPIHEPHDLWFKEAALARRGYSYDFVGPALFELPNARVDGGRLDGAGPAYKALVLDTAEQIDSVDGMPLATARKILDYAREALPVIVVGELPQGTGFFGDRADDPAVGTVIAELLATPGVRQISSEAELADALSDVGVRPDAEPAQPSNLLSVHRSSDGVQFYFLFNQNGVDGISGEPSSEPTVFTDWLSLAGSGRPYRLDAWSGAITPIGIYEAQGERIAIPLRLAPGESTIIALAPPDWADGAGRHGPHAIHTTADEVIATGPDRLRIRDTEAGTYMTRLSDGRVVPSTIGPLPEAKALSSWHLSVEDWQPGASSTEIVKREHEFDLPSLTTWPNIPGLEDVSGIGRYRTEVDLDASWQEAGRGARLELGPVFDSLRVKVNGQPLAAVDGQNPVFDVSGYLRSGVNTIEVEVATTLRNRIRTLPAYAADFEAVERQPYGLVGPVRLIPHGEAALTAQ